MKKLLIPLLVLLCFTAGAQVVTPITPQFTRKVPNDSILTAKVPNIALSFKLPDTSWVKKYTSTFFVHGFLNGTGTLSDPFGIANGYITPAMLHSISGVPGPGKFYSGTGDWLAISGGVANVSQGLHLSGDTVKLGGDITKDTSINIAPSHTFLIGDPVSGNGFSVTREADSSMFSTITGGNQAASIYGLISAGVNGLIQLSSANNSTSRGIQIDPTPSTGSMTVNDSEHKGLVGNELFPKYSGKQYAQYHGVDSIAKAKADSVKGTISSGGVTAIGITTANGVSGTSSGGSTPNLTITLGAITPTSVNGVSAATMGFVDPTSSIQTQLNAKENLSNKATSFGTINNTLYPSVQAVNTQLGNYVPLVGGVTITGEVQSSYTPLAANDLARLTDLGLVPTVLTGMAVTVSGTTATIASGTYRLNNITYTYPGGTVTISAQDGTQYRYSILYITVAGTISVTNGALVPSDPVIPDFPSNSVDVSTIYIPPTGNTITPTGGGNKGTGTVTKVTSSTADILVANQTTTPILTLNKVNGFAISFYDPTSSIQTQLNSKLSTSTASSTYVPLTRTVNGKALSSNITLGLASSDFANQGTTTGLLHGNASGNPSFGPVVNADITNATIDLTTKVTSILPVANGGTGTSTPGIVAGTNVTVSGTWPNQTINSTGSGTTLYSGDGSLAGNRHVSNAAHKLLIDSVYLNVTSAPPSSGGRMYIFGNSIGAGSAATDTLHAYPHLLALGLGYTDRNFSISGSVLENRSPATPFGGYSMLASETNIPTYNSSTDKLLIFELGVNDWQYAGANYTPANYTTDFNSVIAYATGTRGWPASKILILGMFYVNPAIYGTTGTGGGTITQANQNLFIAAAASVASSNSTLYFDVNAYMNTRGGSYLLPIANNIHPNNAGHAVVAQGILNYLNSTVYQTGQTTAANGKVEYNQLYLKNPTSLKADKGTPMGIDSTGQIAPLNNLYQPLINYPTFQNGMYQYGAILPTTYSTNDFIIGSTNKLMSAFSSTIWNYLEISGASGNMNFYNNPGGGVSNGAFKFFGSNPSNTLVFTIGRNGGISTGAVGDPFGTTGYLAGDIVVPSVSTGNGIVSSVAGSYGKLIPQDVSGNSKIINTWSGGKLKIFMSGGSVGGSNEYIDVMPSGMLGLNYFTDEGFNLESLNKARFQGGAYFGKLTEPTANSTLTSTTGGTLAAATYFYKVTAVDAAGNETRPYAETSVTTTGTTSSNTVRWTAGITGAVSYRIYQGTTTNTEGKYFTIAAPATSAVDIGSGYTTATPPTVNSSSFGNILSTGVANFTKLNVGTATNQGAGTATLSSGTVTVSNTAVTASSIILLTYNTPSGTIGVLAKGTVTAGTSFVINSLQAGTASTLNTADTSSVNYVIIN